jgi:C-terminal processing protease CtpA/Prc
MSPALSRRFLGLVVAALAAGSAFAATARSTDPALPILTQAQAREDFDLAVDAVEAGLPNLYWNQSRHDWRAAKADAARTLTNVRDSRDLYRVLAPLLSRIGEGHMALKRSQAMIEVDRATGRYLPLDVHFSADRLFVVEGFGDAADIARGAEILSINGEAPAALLKALMTVRFHDGAIPTEAMRQAEGRGYANFRHRLRGDETVFRLRLRAPDGAIVEKTVTAIATGVRPKADTAEPSPRPTLEWIDPQTAYVVVPTFSNRRFRAAGATTFPEAIKAVFQAVADGGAKDMILDLRENGGGSEPNEGILFSYLVARPLHRYAAVEARGQTVSATSASGRRYEMQLFDAEEMAGQRRLRNGRLTRRNLPPEGLMSHWAPSTPVFKGRLVVLVGGATFSGGAELASMLRHTHRGVFVGEEVGGGDHGNTSGYDWELTLPNSGLELSVPLLQFRFSWRAQVRGRGVFPDCPSPPDVMETGNPRDAAWRTAVLLLKEDWKRPRRAICPARERE